MRRLGEMELISRYLAPLATYPGSFGLKDDAALLTNLPAAGLVVSTDALVAGMHFFEDDDPADAAYKAVAVNVSDLAAKGAKPLAYTMTLALAEAPEEEWARRFASGLERAQNAFGIVLIGGDTVTARGTWSMSITAFGAASGRGLVPRGGAKPGDRLYVSGTIGDAALGLKLRLDDPTLKRCLAEDDRSFLLGRYLYPQPRVALSTALADHASAAMDISDGLAIDLARMCAASGASATVDIARVPLSAAVRNAVAAEEGFLLAVLTGGDDYEILAAVPLEAAPAFETAAAGTGVQITGIGQIVNGSGPPAFIGGNGAQMHLDRGGYEHFA